MTPAQDLAAQAARIHDLLAAANLLAWDQRVMMPPSGAVARGRQVATLKGLARELIVAPAFTAAAEAVLASGDAADLDRHAAGQALLAAGRHRRIPPALLQAQAEQGAPAQAAWAEARQARDFALFLPWLEHGVALAREVSAALAPHAHPYDSQLDLYEPGLDTAGAARLFAQLRAGLRPILDAALGRPRPRTDFLFRDFPADRQRAFCRTLAAHVGLDPARTRFDTSLHPFEISIAPDDVRMTTRFNPAYLPAAIFGTLHEAGHALYELGISPALARGVHTTDLPGLYAVAGTSFGMHESQSRLIEMHVGRSPAFWHQHYGALRDAFPEQLGDVPADEWIAAVNRVEPGLIRVEADELTYDLHVALRVELEAAMLSGDLAPADLPGAWAEGIRRDLGLDVPHDGVGCLQDIHWATGYFGSFATYSIGNLTAAQLASAFASDLHDMPRLKDKLGTAIWRHARSRSRGELMNALGKQAGNPEDYLKYLGRKFR